MDKTKKILVVGAGGFIGGHLTKSLMKSNSLVCADIKPMELWFQQSDKNKNLQLNLHKTAYLSIIHYLISSYPSHYQFYNLFLQVF